MPTSQLFAHISCSPSCLLLWQERIPIQYFFILRDVVTNFFLLLQGFCADADDAALPDQSQAGLFILFLGSFAS
jgi:hypothetical protein